MFVALLVYIRPSQKLFQVINDEVGIRKLVQTLKNIKPELIVLEGSAYAQSAARRLRSESFCGGMEIDAVIQLTQAELAVAVINPRQAQRGRATDALHPPPSGVRALARCRLLKSDD